MIIKTNKYLKTTVQESKGKYTTPIPSGLVKLIGLQKGDKLVWNLSENKADIKNLKFKIKIVKGDKNMNEIIKEETKNIEEFSIKINGRIPLPRCIKNMQISDVETIEISEATINPS